MFGTIFPMTVRLGQEKAVEAHMRRWADERRSKVAGWVDGYLLKSKTHPGELVGVAVFDSEAAFRRNAEDPDQDRWYRQLRELLEADPQWNDGEFVGVA